VSAFWGCWLGCVINQLVLPGEADCHALQGAAAVALRWCCGADIPSARLSVCLSVQEFEHRLVPGKKVDFIEQFNNKLLVKQEDENLEIMDVRTGDITQVCTARHESRSECRAARCNGNHGRCKAFALRLAQARKWGPFCWEH
jgi:hypothetical protein